MDISDANKCTVGLALFETHCCLQAFLMLCEYQKKSSLYSISMGFMFMVMTFVSLTDTKVKKGQLISQQLKALQLPHLSCGGTEEKINKQGWLYQK